MKRLLVLLVVGACFLPNAQIMKWPERGALVKVVNASLAPVQILVEDGQGRMLSKGTVNGWKSLCFRWPWIDERGRLLAVARDTVMTGWWHPWAYDRWTWTVGDPAPLAGKAC